MSASILSSLLLSEQRGTLHHAYLLTGPEGPAKRDCVERLLAEFSGGGGLFGESLSKEQTLERIKRGNHPDFLKIQTEESAIGVDDVRVLSKALSYAPLEAKKRIVIIENAHLMNAQAANAVLKVLEEPPSHTMFFLLCRDAADLLPTILSRCQELRFAPPSQEELLKLLNEEFPQSEEASLNRAISLSSGSIERAKNFLKIVDAEFWKLASDQILNYWDKSPKIPSSIVQWAESQLEQEDIQWIVDIWEAMLRDLALVILSEENSEITFPEFRVRYKELAQKLNISPEIVAEKKSSIHRFRVYRELNGNLKLDFLSLICDLNFSVGKRTQPV